MNKPLLARPAHLLSAALLFPLATAVNFNCDDVVAGDHLFNFKPLGGHHSVSHVTESPPRILNTTYTIDICAKLGRDSDIPLEEQCDEGTRICGITNLYTGDHKDVEHVLPIARQYEHDSAFLDPKLQILPDSNSNADSEKKGLRVIMGGGKDTTDGKKVPQQAVIEFLCLDESSMLSSLSSVGKISRADDNNNDEEGKPNPEWEKLKSTEDGHGGTLSFISYSQDEKQGTLHLEWKTKYACREYDGSNGDGGSGSSGGWGFFSWIFFLGFIGLLGYFGVFAWINYNKYGATGWDLVPHADTIRDMPYVLSDWGHKVVGSITGGPSRGGYSAV